MINKILNFFHSKSFQIGSTYEEVISFKYFLRRIFLEDKILNCDYRGITDKEYASYEIIISLTTYGRRIHDVCFTIESLMQQTFKANKIILWLDEETYSKPIPEALKRQQERGLLIYPCKDLRSYKKLIPALKKYPDAAIITADDDIIYDFDLVERIIKAHIDDPNSIQACRVHTMTFDNSNRLKPYEKWDWCKATSTKGLFITGGGGTLYPPHALSSEVINEDIFMKICPTADDVWFTAMAKLKGTSIKKVETRSNKGEDYVINEDVQDIGLWKLNVGESGKNNEQIKAVFSKYNIYELIR